VKEPADKRRRGPAEDLRAGNDRGHQPGDLIGIWISVELQ
jgi:hypothetical protein